MIVADVRTAREALAIARRNNPRWATCPLVASRVSATVWKIRVK